MKNLLSMELKRAFLSPILWIGILVEIGINIYHILLSSYGFTRYTTSSLFYNSSLICIIIGIFISLHIGYDFETRTINNKITADYSRKQIYLVEVGTNAICSSILFIVDIISVFVCSTIAHLEFDENVTYGSFIINATISLICIITISSLFTMLAMITRKQLLSLGLILLLAFGMLSFGEKAVSGLHQENTWSDPITQEIVDNPLYLKGIRRTTTNLHLLISPFAQVKYEHDMLIAPEEKADNSSILKNAPYHLEFCIFNLLELLLFCKIGIHLFKKQDLK